MSSDDLRQAVGRITELANEGQGILASLARTHNDSSEQADVNHHQGQPASMNRTILEFWGLLHLPP